MSSSVDDPMDESFDGFGAIEQAPSTIRVSVAVVEPDAAARDSLVRQLGDGVTPFASAARWILSPCSSVPVRNMTSSPQSRRQRARASATTVVYAWPMCGTSFT